MQSLVGTWKLVEVGPFDDVGRQQAPPLGQHPMGVMIFETGRMLGAICDGGGPLPPGAAPRAFGSYCGAYSFDGLELRTQVDGLDPTVVSPGAISIRSSRKGLSRDMSQQSQYPRQTFATRKAAESRWVMVCRRNPKLRDTPAFLPVSWPCHLSWPLVTRLLGLGLDGASTPDLLVDQVRHVRFDGPTRIRINPVSGALGNQSHFELVWERVG